MDFVLETEMKMVEFVNGVFVLFYSFFLVLREKEIECFQYWYL